MEKSTSKGKKPGQPSNQADAAKIAEFKAEVDALIKDLRYEDAKATLEHVIYKTDLLKNYPKDRVEFVDTYSEVLVILDYSKEAKAAIRESIGLDPDHNGDKYMSLGQLTAKPRERLEIYSTGVRVFQRDLLESQSDPDRQNSLRSKLATAYAAIAELYMTTELW